VRRNAFKVVVADPPWPFSDKLPGPKRGAEAHYRTMKIPDICNYMRDVVESTHPIAKRSILFMWGVSAMQQELQQVVSAWGYTVKSEIIWVKTQEQSAQERLVHKMPTIAFGMGRYVRLCHERCVIAVRGAGAQQIIKDHSTRSVFFAPRGKHSAKPDAFYRLVEQLTDGPYIELFARRHQPGWTCTGDQVGERP
jgi:N6-adenosine-specific RNA methylase IME4